MKKEIKTVFNCVKNWQLNLLFMLVFCIITMPIKAQEERPLRFENSDESKKKDNFICTLVSEPSPEFIGGSKAMFKFLSENLHFTSDSTRIPRTIYVGFVVETDGSISEVTIRRGSTNAANEEAMRVVKLMSGKWKCGYQNGKPARVRFTLPIKFCLE